MRRDERRRAMKACVRQPLRTMLQATDNFRAITEIEFAAIMMTAVLHDMVTRIGVQISQ